MIKRGIIKITRDVVEPAAEELGYDLIDVEYVKEMDNYFLRVYIDKRGGVDLDDCQKISEILSTELDKEDPVDEPYYLEVSSPGLDRPLKTDRDLERNIGRDIELSFYTPVDNRKKIEGTLLKYDDEKIYIEIDEEEREIPRDIISLIKIVIRF